MADGGALNIAFSYEDVPTIQEFAASDAFIRGLMGPFGSGKSSGCVVELVRRGRKQKPGPDGIARSRWAVVRNTYGELKDTTMKTVEQWLPERHFGRLYVAEHRYMVTRFPGCEIEIMFRALDRPDHVKHLLSLELTGAWINEAREIQWPVIEAIQGRVGRYPAKRDGGPTWSGVFMDTNPPDSESQWYKFFEDRNWLRDFERLKQEGVMPADMRPEQYAAIFKQPGGLDREAENLTNLPAGRGYYARLGIGKKPEWKKVFIDGQYGFVVEGKPVYPEYIDTFHCKDVDPVPGIKIMRGWDFGLTPACVFAQILPTGQFLVFDEMVATNMSVDRFSDDVNEHCARSFQGAPVTFEDWGDPAGQNRAETDARSSFDILHAKKIYIRPSPTQSPRLRQDGVRSPMTAPPFPDENGNIQPMFILNSRCKVLRRGFLGGYHHRRLKVSGVERYSDEPEKNPYSHPHDALQYVMAPCFVPNIVRQEQEEESSPFHHNTSWDFVDDRTRNPTTGY